MRIIKICLLLFSIVWIIGFTTPAIFELSLLTNILISKFYSPVCHQIPEKTFELFGTHLLVCARCTGIYLGAFVMIAITLLKKQSQSPTDLDLKWFVISSALLLIDVLASTAGIYSYSKLLAFGSGLFFGFVVLNFIQQGLAFTFPGRKNADVV